MSLAQEISEEETVEVVTNTTPEETVEEVFVPTPEPQLQTIQVEEEKVNGLKETKTTALARRVPLQPERNHNKKVYNNLS